MFSFHNTLHAFLIFDRIIFYKMQALIININKKNLVTLFYFVFMYCQNNLMPI